MKTVGINACLALLDPEEIGKGPRLIEAWLRSGWVSPYEADEWRRRFDAWGRYHALEPEPPTPN